LVYRIFSKRLLKQLEEFIIRAQDSKIIKIVKEQNYGTLKIKKIKRTTLKHREIPFC